MMLGRVATRYSEHTEVSAGRPAAGFRRFAFRGTAGIVSGCPVIRAPAHHMGQENPVSWCDKLASTPTVGIALDSHVAPSETLLAALAPVLDKWTDGNALNFTVDNISVFTVTITSNSGFKY